MAPSSRSLPLIFFMFIGSLLIYFGIYTYGVCLENHECVKIISTHVHSKSNSLQAKYPAAAQEKNAVFINDHAAHSIVLGNSASLSKSLKTEESLVKVIPRINTLRGRFKRHTRRKRSNPKGKSSEWQFSLNVTRIDKQTASEPKTDVTIGELNSEKPRQPLGVTINVGGNDPEDYHLAWNSTESFIKNLFGGNIEELGVKGHDIFIDLNSLPSKTHASDSESRSQPRDKEGKFLFGFFGGSNSENPPIDEGSGEAFEPANITDLSFHDAKLSNIAIVESALETNLPVESETESVTLLPAVLNESTGVQQMESTVNLKKLEVRDLVLVESIAESTPLVEFIKDGLPTPSEKHLKECIEIECNVSIQGNELNGQEESPTPETSTIMARNMNAVHNSSTAEEVREMCIILLQRMQKSPRRLEELNDIEGSGNFKENEASSMPSASQGQISTIQQRPQNLGIFANFLNLFRSGRLRQESSSDDIDSKNSSELETDNREARTFDLNNLFGGFGSGRSAQSNDFENMKFDDMDLTAAHDFGRDTPSLSECVMFFRHIQSINSTVETHFEDTLTLLDKTTISYSTEVVPSIAFGNTDARDLILEGVKKQEAIDNMGTVKDLLSESTTDGTDIESRFFNLLGFENGQIVGSGFSEVEGKLRSTLDSFSNGSDGRLVTEDFLIDSNTENPSTSASQELRIIPGLFNFGSGDRNLESFPFEDKFDVTADNNESFGEFADLRSDETYETSSARFPVRETLQFENASVSKPYAPYPAYPDFADYEIVPDSEIQTWPPTEHESLSDSLKSKDAQSSFTETGKDRLFAGFLNLFGSGDGELVESNGKSSNRTQSGCVVCTVGNDTHPSISCTECPLENPPSHLGQTDLAVTEPSESGNVEPFEHSIPSSPDGAVMTTSKVESFMNGRLFLSANEGSTDQINLVHETELTSLPSSSVSPRKARRGRFDDEIPIDKADEIDENIDSAFNILVRQDEEDYEFVNEPKKVTRRTINPTSSSTLEHISKRPGGSSSPLPSNLTLKEPGTVDVTKISSSMKPRRCYETSECEASLNEKCFTKGYASFCDCGRYFVRHPVTWRCDEPAPVKLSLNFPFESFHEDLREENSERFQSMRKDSLETIKLFLSRSPELVSSLAKVIITGFEEGSLIVESDLIFARSGRNQSLVDFVVKVHANIREAVEDEQMWRRAPLNAEGAYVAAVSAVANRCEAPELNNCSPNAKCIPDAGDFNCRCNEGYLDNSRFGAAGEECIELCPPNYCGDNGFCDLKSKGGKLCLCSGWYFGKRCEVNGLVVIVGFAGLNILVVLIITAAVCFCRRRRRSRSHYHTDLSSVRENSLVHKSGPSYLQYEVTMNDFKPESTPKSQMMGGRPIIQTALGPKIKLTSPNCGSSISYDFDSTFDQSEYEDIESRL